MEDWAPQMAQDDWGSTEPESPITEEFDPTWPYNLKWGIDGRTGDVHTWRVKGGVDGRPYHRTEFESRLGRPPQVRQGDLLGVASYIPAEVKLDGTLVAPPTITVHTYYGMDTPQSVFDQLEREYPGAAARNGVLFHDRFASVEIPWEWQQKATPEAIQSLRTELAKEHPEEDISLEEDPALRSDFPTNPAYREIVHQRAAAWAQEALSGPPSTEDKGFIENWVAGLRRALRRSGAKGADHDGAMVALYVPEEVGKKIRLRGGEPLKDLHITLAYFTDAAADRDDWDKAAKIVEQFSKSHGAFKGTIGGHGIFNQETGDVLWASADLPGINELHHELVEALEDAGFPVSKEHGFTPHITLKYDHKGSLPKLDKPLDVSFDQLTLATGGKKQDYTFEGDGFMKIISEL